MTSPFNNVPYPKLNNSSDATIQAFDAYYTAPFELSADTYTAMKSFFTGRGFDDSAAESIAVIIMKQAKKDGYNPMQILDTLKGLDSVEISALVSEILNYNRFKTSFLGYALEFTPHHEIQRNIIDIIEAAPPLPKSSYSIVPSVTTITEGNYLVFTINTVNVSNGVTLYWNLLGSTVSAADIYQGITSGSVVINNNSASVTLEILDDGLVELDEILNFNLKTGSSSGPTVATSAVTVTDKQVIEFIIADYIVIEYLFTTGRDLDTRTKLVSPLIGNYVGWGLDSVVKAPVGLAPTLLEWGGDNTGIGTESTLFNVMNFRTTYPTTANIKIDCRAQWYNEIGTTPVGLKISLFKGGTMQKQGFTWVNPTAAVSQVYNTSLKQITLSSQIGASTGERFAVLNYNTFTGIGLLDTEDTTVY